MVEDVLPFISTVSDIETQTANDTIKKGSASGANFSTFDIPSDMPIESTVPTLLQTPTSNGGTANNFLSEIPSLDLADIDIEFEW